MTVAQIQNIRTASRISGGLSILCGITIIYALCRMLTSNPSHKHHPKLSGTTGYFTLLLLCTCGDCLTSIGFCIFSFGLPEPEGNTTGQNTTNTILTPPQNASCVAQGFVLQVGATSSVVFSSLVAIEMYNVITIPFWTRRLTMMVVAGFCIVLIQSVLAGALYGFGGTAGTQIFLLFHCSFFLLHTVSTLFYKCFPVFFLSPNVLRSRVESTLVLDPIQLPGGLLSKSVCVGVSFSCHHSGGYGGVEIPNSRQTVCVAHLFEVGRVSGHLLGGVDTRDLASYSVVLRPLFQQHDSNRTDTSQCKIIRFDLYFVSY